MYLKGEREDEDSRLEKNAWGIVDGFQNQRFHPPGTRHQAASILPNTSSNPHLLWHVFRSGDISVQRLVLQGKVEGTTPHGRSPMRWTDQVKAALNGSLCE